MLFVEYQCVYFQSCQESFPLFHYHWNSFWDEEVMSQELFARVCSCIMCEIQMYGIGHCFLYINHCGMDLVLESVFFARLYPERVHHYSISFISYTVPYS